MITSPLPDTQTILIIDDDPVNLAVIVDYLEAYNFQVIVARDGQAGLKRAAYVCPDLILLDVMMPDMDGFETCRRLKATAATQDIPVIFMTALTSTEDRLTGFDAGAVDYITKPFQTPEVLARIKTHLHLRNLQKQLQAQNTQLQQEISERLRAEQAHRESEARLQTLIDNLPVQFWAMDTNLCYIMQNATTFKDYGNIIGKHVAELDIPAALKEIWNEQNRRVFTGAIAQKEYERQIDGETRIFQSLAAPVIVGETIVGIVGAGIDITERKRAEAELNEYREHLEELVAQRAGELSRANKQLQQEIAERTVVEEEIQRRNRELSLLNRVIAASAGQTSPETILEVACRELAQAFNSPQGVVALFNKEKTEATVVAEYLTPNRLSTLRYKIPTTDNPMFQYIFQQKTPMMVGDIQSNPKLSKIGKLLNWPTLSSLFVIPIVIDNEVIGCINLETVDPSYFISQEGNLAKSVADQVAGVLARLQLEKERQQLETQYYQSQKMEAIGRLTGGVTHDFNNILIIIIANSEFLLDALGEHHPFSHFVKQIQQATSRAAALTRQLLAFSRQQILQPKMLNLNTVVSDIEKMLHRLIGEDINLLTVLDPDLGQIKADPGQVEQVIMNLVINARDAMPGGGKLTIETTNAYLDEAYARQHPGVTPGPYAMLAISDTGHGMDAATQARIFEPFFTTKSQEKGTGLGLSTVHGIVNQSNGHIWVYSEVEIGTTFKIFLPQVIEAATEAGKAQSLFAKPHHGTETILLVEDDDLVRRASYQILVKYGYTVLVANDGEQAYQTCANFAGTIHLLLTDVILPGQITGPQLAKTLATTRPQLKVLYMSGYTDNPIVHNELSNPEVAFLPKPFLPNDLARKIRQVLDGI